MTRALLSLGEGTRLRTVLTSSAFLGVVVSLASWNVTFAVQGAGLDPSWQAGLYMAVHHGLDFGSQVAFTYGPLGFLKIPNVYYAGLGSLAFVYSSLLFFGFCTSLVWGLRRKFGAVIAVIATFLTAAVFTLVDYAVVLAAAWCFIALGEDAPPFARRLVVVGGGVLAAVEFLAKLNPGITIVALVAITVCAMDGRRWRWNIPVFAGTFVVSVSVLWLASGQGIDNVGDYVRASAQVVSGYSQAMGLENPELGWEFPWAGVAVAVLVFGALAPTRDLPWSRRAILILMLAVVVFPLYKEGFVRHEDNHATIFFSTVFAIALAVLPTLERRTVAGPAIGAIAVIAVVALPSGSSISADPIDHLRTFKDEVRSLVDSKRRTYLTEVDRALMTDTYRLDPRSLDLLHGHTIHVDPWEAGVAWAYNLDWQPLPVFQEYSAYTEELDRINAESAAAPDGSDRILRENVSRVDPTYPHPTIDGRYPAWDPPATHVAMLCNFEALRTTGRWQVLGRVANRCGRRRLIRSVDTRFGATVEVPKPRRRDEAVIAVIHGAAVEGLERVRTLAYRAEFRYAVIDGSRTYRLVPGTASDGLLVDTPCSVDFPKPFALGPHAHTLRLVKGDSDAPLEVDFYAMRVRPASRGC